MVPAFIFILHFALIIYVFIKYKKDGTGEGFLAAAFVGIIFAVGWTVATILTNLIFAFDWFEKWYWQNLDSWVLLRIRKEFSRDTISLLILTSIEIVFYYFFFIDKRKIPSKKDTPSSGSTTSV